MNQSKLLFENVKRIFDLKKSRKSMEFDYFKVYSDGSMWAHCDDDDENGYEILENELSMSDEEIKNARKLTKKNELRLEYGQYITLRNKFNTLSSEEKLMLQEIDERQKTREEAENKLSNEVTIDKVIDFVSNDSTSFVSCKEIIKDLIKQLKEELLLNDNGTRATLVNRRVIEERFDKYLKS